VYSYGYIGKADELLLPEAATLKCDILMLRRDKQQCCPKKSFRKLPPSIDMDLQ
jgi:hypothetical protein